MDTSEACERRAWRLAALLTGDRARTERIVAQTLDAQPDPTLLPDARLDRLVIMRVREQAGPSSAERRVRRPTPSLRAALERLRTAHRKSRGQVAAAPISAKPDESDGRLFDGPASGAHDAVLSLPEQPRAAWILRELDGKDMIEIARAMDCSKTAAARHLEQAHDRMSFLLGDDAADAVRALSVAADRLDPGEFIVRRAIAKKRGRRMRLIMWAAIVVIVVVVGVSLWARFG